MTIKMEGIMHEPEGPHKKQLPCTKYLDSHPLWLSGYHGNAPMPWMVMDVHTEEAVNST